nr:hypothetical protein Iba_chr13fCG1450 [Ipomoea batatas]
MDGDAGGLAGPGEREGEIAVDRDAKGNATGGNEAEAADAIAHHGFHDVAAVCRGGTACRAAVCDVIQARGEGASLLNPAFSNNLIDPGFSTSTTASSRSRWGHSTNTDAAVIFTALVAIPFPQYLDASAYPISARHLSQPLNGFTDTDPTAFPFTHIPRYHGCPAARPAMYSAAASTVVTGSHEQNLLKFSSDRNSSRSRWGHSTNTDAAAIFTALVAIPFPQYLDASAYPISALQLSQPLNGFTDTDPTTFPFTHIPRYHGCPAARPAMYSAAASTVVTGSHEQNLRTFSSDRHSRNRLDMTVLAVSLTLPFLLPFVDGETEV